MHMVSCVQDLVLSKQEVLPVCVCLGLPEM